MIQEIPTYTANPALRNPVLPRTSECSANRLTAHCLHGRDNIGTELRVPIEDQEPMGLIAVFPSLVQLHANPKPVRVASRVAVENSATIVADDEEQYRTPKVRVGTVKKSMPAMASRWFRRKVNQRCVGSAGLGARYAAVSMVVQLGLMSAKPV
jgi:hypothetical protein